MSLYDVKYSRFGEQMRCAIADTLEQHQNDINHFYANLLPSDDARKIDSNVTYTRENGEYNVDGTASSTSIYDIDGSTTTIPDWLKDAQGKDIRVLFDSRFDIFSTMTKENYQLSGVSFNWNLDGSCTVNGEASSTIYKDLYNNTSALPDTVKAGETYRLEYQSDNVAFRVYFYNSGTPIGTSVNAYESTDITIPDDCNGIIFRLAVSSGRTADHETVYPKLWKDTGLELRITHFNNAHPNGLVLMKTKQDCTYRVPELSIYTTGVSVRLWCASGSEFDDFKVKPIITNALNNEELTNRFPYYDKPLITIIDDDGDVHFKYDLLPFIDEMKVPIASAVTTTRIADAEAGTNTRWMTWSDVKTCALGGAEIVCHMYAHETSTEIVNMTTEELAHRLQMAKQYMKSNGVDSKTLVYSYGSGGEAKKKMETAAEQVFDCGFIASGVNVFEGEPNHCTYDRYWLNRYRIDYEIDYDVDDLKAIVDDIVENGGWAVLMIHTSGNWRKLVVDGQITEDVDTDGTHANTAGKLLYMPALRMFIQYAIANGVPIVTTEYGVKKYFKETAHFH